MDNLTKGALGVTALVMLGAIGYAVTKVNKAEGEKRALAKQVQSIEKQRDDDKTAELERKLTEAKEEQRKTREQMNEEMQAELQALREELASATTAASEERRIVEAEAEQISETLAERARREEAELESTLSPLQKKIREAAAIGKVSDVQSDLGFVVIGAGSANGIQPEQRYNVRRGTFIVGEIVVESVEDERNAIANIDPSKSAPGLALRVGDDVIGHPIF